MAFTVEVGESAVIVELTGWDRLMNGIQQVIIDKSQIMGAESTERGALESSITHRALGCGTHNGAKRPNKRRVGTMLGSGLAGSQFWATAKGEGCD